MNFKESLAYNNNFLYNKKKNLDTEMSDNKLIYHDLEDSCVLINYLKKKFQIVNLDYNNFTNKLEELFGNFIYCISKDEDNKYLLINRSLITSSETENIKELENFTTTLYKKSPFKKIASFITPTLLNNNVILKIKSDNNILFNKLAIKTAMEGIDVVFVFDKDTNEWKTITEKSLNGFDSHYRNKKIKELINEIITSKNINLNLLNKEHIYYFKLVHHKNNGILNFNHYGSGYKELYLNYILNKDKLLINPSPDIFEDKINIKYVQQLFFENVTELIDSLNQLSYDNMSSKKITQEGFEIYDYNTYKLMNYKIQTHIYQQILYIKPKCENINLGYLELYQDNKLNEYLPYFTNYHGEIIHRISMSIRTISKELLDIYHFLKKNKKSELYNNIPNNYKKVLYKIHGIYIDARKSDFIKNNSDTVQVDSEEITKVEFKSITVHDIYHYIKSLSLLQLKQLYIDREEIIKEKKVNENIYNLLVKDCVYTMTQTKLMIFN